MKTDNYTLVLGFEEMGGYEVCFRSWDIRSGALIGEYSVTGLDPETGSQARGRVYSMDFRCGFCIALVGWSDTRLPSGSIKYTLEVFDTMQAARGGLGHVPSGRIPSPSHQAAGLHWKGWGWKEGS